MIFADRGFHSCGSPSLQPKIATLQFCTAIAVPRSLHLPLTYCIIIFGPKLQSVSADLLIVILTTKTCHSRPGARASNSDDDTESRLRNAEHSRLRAIKCLRTEAVDCRFIFVVELSDPTVEALGYGNLRNALPVFMPVLGHRSQTWYDTLTFAVF